jgi:hypothetical protein
LRNYAEDLQRDQVRLHGLLQQLIDQNFKGEALQREIRILHASIQDRLELWEEMKEQSV